MQMISFVFFFFLALVFLILYVLDKLVRPDQVAISISNRILLIASYVVVIYADWRFALILLVITFTSWFGAKYESFRRLGIAIPVFALFVFKYFNFFAASFAGLLGRDYTVLNILLPMGISFYSFSAISYILDVARKRVEVRSFKDVALYLAFFPKLTSGPIQRSKEFFVQMDRRRHIGFDTFSVGIQIFLIGLFKKLVLADRLSVFVNQVYDKPLAFGSLTVFLAAVAYSFQIYFDFSGYSDMAIGVARLLGFDLPRNFNLPYLSQNVTELWKRWHISLSTWLQDYLYISLGGNRKGKVRTYVNLILTMVLGGIWHGASFTYIIWGLLHGLALALHKKWMELTKSYEKTSSLFARVVSMAVTFFYTTFCWIFFRAESFKKACLIIARIFSFSKGLEQLYLWLWFVLFVYGLSVLAAALKSKKEKASSENRRRNNCYVDGYYPLLDITTFIGLTIFFVFGGLILCLAYTGGSPFIYGNY